MMNQNLLNNYRTRTFTDIFPLVTDFEDFYENCGIPHKIDDEIETVYFLLVSRYANSHIASSDETRFAMQMMSIIFQYGPAWAKQIALQDELVNASTADLKRGTRAVHNTALNPETDVAVGQSIGEGTSTVQELSYINSQNTTNYEKGIIELFGQVKDIINTNVTEIFLDKFKNLFTKFPAEKPIWYITQVEDE